MSNVFPFLKYRDETAKDRKARLKAVKDMPKKLKTMTSRKVSFDGDMAEAWWESMISNRVPQISHVKRLADKMVIKEDGSREFRVTSQGISVNKRGKVQDGGHRLLAIVWYYLTNDDAQPVTMWVTEGEDDNFEFFDQGKNRSAADVFEIDGLDNPAELANAARLVYLRMHGKKVAGGGKLSPYELKQFTDQHPDLSASVSYILKFGDEEDSFPCRELMSPGYAAALHYLMCNCTDVDKPRQKADEFWRQVIDQDADKKTPTRILYTVLKKAKSNDVKNRDFKLSRDLLVDHCIQAFNDWVDGETYTKIKLPDDYKPGLGGLDGSLAPEDSDDSDG